jgi:acetyltransferase-like isoleucine patch superfamily enzyme
MRRSQTMGLDPSSLGVNTNFFEMGGDSLLVIKLISMLRQTYNAGVGVADFLRHPTIADFALAISSSANPDSIASPATPHRQQRVASLLPRRKTHHKQRSTSTSKESTENLRGRTPSIVEGMQRSASSEERARSASVAQPSEEPRARSPSGYDRDTSTRTRTYTIANTNEADPRLRGSPQIDSTPAYRMRTPSHKETSPEIPGSRGPTRGRALTIEVPDPNRISPRLSLKEPARISPPPEGGHSPRALGIDSPRLSFTEPPNSPRVMPNNDYNRNPTVPKLFLEDMAVTPSTQNLINARVAGDTPPLTNALNHPPPPSPDYAARMASKDNEVTPGEPETEATPAPPTNKPSRLKRNRPKPARTISLSTLEDANTMNQVFTTPLPFLWLRQLIALIIVALPVLGSFAGSYIAVRIISEHYHINLFYLIPIVYPAGGFVSSIVFIPYKWIWIRRYKHCVMRLWSWKYMVWWALERYRYSSTSFYTLIFAYIIYRSFVSSLFLNYAAGTPFINFYYTLCGMSVGRNVYINTTNISEFDLVILEDEACIDEGTTLCGHVFEDGAMKLGDVLIRQYTTIGAWSIVNPYAEVDEGTEVGPFSLVALGMYIPPEETWQGSPAVKKSARPFEEHDVGPLFTYSAYAWTIPFVLFTWAFTTALFYGAALATIRMIIFVADKYGFLTAGGFLPIGLIGLGLAQTFAGLVTKRILLGRAFPGTYRVYGSYYLRRWAVAQVSKLSLLVSMIVSSTSLASWYYSLWGATVGKETEIMMVPSLCDSDLVSIGNSSFLGSETRFLTSQVKVSFLLLLVM